MQREANDHINKIINTIQFILDQNKVPNTPHNIIKYTTDSIIALLKSKDTRNVKDLLSVIFVFQDFLQGELTELLCVLIENGLEEKAFRIIKILFGSGRGEPKYIELLLKYYLKGISKNKMYYMAVQHSEDLREIIFTFPEKEFLILTNAFFEEVFQNIEFKNKLDGFIKHVQSTTGDYKSKEEEWKIILNVLFRYITWLGDFDRIKEINLTEEILYISSRVQEAGLTKGGLSLRVLGKVIETDWIYYCRFNSNVFEINKDTKEFIKRIINQEETNHKAIEEFFSSVKHTIIPTFIDLVRELCERYNNESQEKVSSILKVIVNQIGILELISIMEGPVDYAKWIPIFSTSSNNDLKTFMDILQNTEEKEKIYALIPSFCNYCTDHYNAIEGFMQVIKECLRDKLYYGVACSGIRNLIVSHEMNLNKTCLLRNPIEKNNSLQILSLVYNESLFFTILKFFNSEQIPKEILFLIIPKLKGIESINRALVEYILSYPDSTPIVIKGISISDITECLNIAKFFISFCELSFDLPSKIVELCSSENHQIQKKAYEFLYYLEKENKIEVCVCEHINSPDLLLNFKPSSMKYKLLYLNLPRPCKKPVVLYQNIILSFIYNISARRVSEDLLDNIYLNNNNDFLDTITKGIKSNSIEIVSGCINAFTYLVQKYSTAIPFGTQKEIYGYVCTSYKSLNALMVIKSILGFLRHTDVVYSGNGKDSGSDVVDGRDVSNGRGVITPIVDILEYYIDVKKKKYRVDIKEVVHVLLQRKMPVTRKLKRYTNFRIPTNKQTLTITKNNEIIIQEE